MLLHAGGYRVLEGATIEAHAMLAARPKMLPRFVQVPRGHEQAERRSNTERTPDVDERPGHLCRRSVRRGHVLGHPIYPAFIRSGGITV